MTLVGTYGSLTPSKALSAQVIGPPILDLLIANSRSNIPPVLSGPVGAYLILYRAQGDRIEIVALTQGARDIPTFLNERTD